MRTCTKLEPASDVARRASLLHEIWLIAYVSGREPAGNVTVPARVPLPTRVPATRVTASPNTFTRKLTPVKVKRHVVSALISSKKSTVNATSIETSLVSKVRGKKSTALSTGAVASGISLWKKNACVKAKGKP